ncbi:MAG: AzlD domain-containing protein [Beijerinckiaceae bacterium]|nr:AzlD domain-containing protein [Beijerinckiaceae bacterium]
MSDLLLPYVLLIVVGFLPTEIWRSLAVFLSRGLNEGSQLIVWIRAVATALLTGVVAKLMLAPTGELALVPYWGRGGAILIAFCAFFIFRRSVIGAVIAGEAMIIAAAYFARAQLSF